MPAAQRLSGGRGAAAGPVPRPPSDLSVRECLTPLHFVIGDSHYPADEGGNLCCPGDGTFESALLRLALGHMSPQAADAGRRHDAEYLRGGVPYWWARLFNCRRFLGEARATLTVCS